MLEVKSKDGRGRTEKARAARATSGLDALTADDQDFVDRTIGRPGVAGSLAPVLTTRYRRSTVADLGAGTRATIDHGLVCRDRDGRTVTLGVPIIETKSNGSASTIDRWLWQRGCRPEPISKYCTALARLDPDLPAHRWRRTLRRHFDD